MSKSVEKRHAIQKGHRPMDQMEYQGIIWVIKSDADKRITELEDQIANIRDIAENTVEINMSNFNDNDVSEQNNALIEIWQVLNISEGGADE